jgi:hypothetical protein
VDKPLRKPFIFIVYQDFEHKLAYNLQRLLEIWGYEAFQCRQGDRDGEAFRRELRENIRKSDLVLFLLSREFRWSAYCQAEAGTAMALEKSYIPIIISPATPEEVGKEIAPVLEGSQFLFALDPDFISLLQSQILRILGRSKESLTKLISKLQHLQEIELSAPAIHDVGEETESRQRVLSSIQTIDENYRLSRPKKAVTSSWSTLGDPACKASIIGNIKNLLKGEDNKVALTLVGVSLKFSLHFITTALEELHVECAKAPPPRKTLSISLIHMHDQSHILHALGDQRDISSIRDSFGTDWATTKKAWKSLCGETIELFEPAVYRIDYIPPRVGIMLEAGDRSFLYAGRCAFKQTDSHSHFFNLDVGENEYLFYSKNWATKSDDTSLKAIAEFKAAFNAYREMHNNLGITPIWESRPWIYRLLLAIEELEGPAEITFVSGTATVFEPLIIKALEKGAKVRTYVSDCGTSFKQARDLHKRLTKQKGNLADKVEQHRYQHPATFRGMVIKDKIIGLQTYVKTDGDKASWARRQPTNMEIVRKIPLCLIITPCFEHFEKLQMEMLTFAESDPTAEEIIALE